MLDVALIVNPYASGVTRERAEAVARVLGGLGTVRTLWTEAPGHATELAGGLQQPDAIVVFSGDGGFNEVLNGVDGQVPVAFVPGGGASVLPRALGLPRDPVAAARRILDAGRAGRRRRISLGRVNGRRFAFAAGVGLDAEVVRRVDARGRARSGSRPGNRVYAWEIARVLAARRGRLEPVLTVAGQGRASFALVANTDPYTYAGLLPIRAAPEARFELGLDLVAPTAVRPATIPRLAVYALTGLSRSAPGLLYAHDRDRLEVRCDRPLPVQADGEDLGDAVSLVFECERSAVDVLV